MPPLYLNAANPLFVGQALPCPDIMWDPRNALDGALSRRHDWRCTSSLHVRQAAADLPEAFRGNSPSENEIRKKKKSKEYEMRDGESEVEKELAVSRMYLQFLSLIAFGSRNEQFGPSMDPSSPGRNRDPTVPPTVRCSPGTVPGGRDRT